MFEHFTEKAINAVSEAQRYAHELKSSEVCPEHLLLALVSEAKGVSLKLFRMYGITKEDIESEVQKYIRTSLKPIENVPFSQQVKEILKRSLDLTTKSGNTNILFEHLFLSVITDKNSCVPQILEHFNFDIMNAREILTRLVQKKIKKLEHPEEEDDEEKGVNDSLEGEELADVFNRAVSKLSAKGYEILGTEQIMASILESVDSSLVNTINNNGINAQIFEEKLASISSRQSEYEGKKIIYTPNAFLMMNNAMQIAKDLGASILMPEHIVLSILKTKTGLAYEIIKSLNIDEDRLTKEIIKPIEKQMSEMLTIMKLAKEEARRIGRNVVGTEMFLLGILGEGTSIVAEVLSDLEITIKDARLVVENLVGFGNEYFDEEIVFTKRAKRVLEKAWQCAKKDNKTRIEAVDLLMAIIEEPESLAMKSLEILGVDAAEIRHGIQRIKW